MKSFRYLQKQHTMQERICKDGINNACKRYTNILLHSIGTFLSLPPLYAGIRQSQEELVEFKGRGFVSVEPHCIACCLAQFVPHRAGDQWDGEAVHLLATHSGEEARYITVLS